ncbi:hypothetical protein [Flavobacterium ovatum]|uniref:hypothetical protein n=1 Tax=Flavobacterium ovatum TaxID=1928857 RepID=UPI00344FFA6F
MKPLLISLTVTFALLPFWAQSQEHYPSIKAKNPINFSDLKKKNIVSDTDIIWQQFGPGMSGNNKSAMWHPTDPNVLYISPNMGNTYRTTNKGFTYETILDEDGPGIKSGERGPQELGSIDFSRQNPNFGFCTDLKNNGIFFTNDKGKSWQKQQTTVDTFAKAFLACVAVDPKNENIWYLGAGQLRNTGRILFSQENPRGNLIDKNSLAKIWKSTNKGKSWDLITNGLQPNTEVETVAVDPKNSNILYATTSSGFYKSSDAGKNWELKSKGIDNTVLRSVSTQYDPKTDKLTMYVLSNRVWKADGNTVTDQSGGIFKSTDRGESWTNVDGNLALDLNQFKNNKSVLQTYYNAVAYFFGISIEKAKKSYPEMPSKITHNFCQIQVDPNDANNVYLVNMFSNMARNNFMPGCMWRSKDGGKNWYVTFRNGKNWSSGPDVKYWADRGNPTGSNVKLKYLHQWENRDDYDRKSTNFGIFNADGTVLHTQMAKISLMSYDKGDTWVDIDDVQTSPATESYIGAGNSNLPGHGFYQSYLTPNKVYCSAGENSLWITNNETSPERPGAQAATCKRLLDDEISVSCYAIHPKDPKIHFALFFRQKGRGELYRSTDSGETWVKHGTPIPAWEVKAHSGDQSVHQLSLIIDPNNPDTMYFCVPKAAKNMEYVGDSETGFGIHKSIDGGKTWTEPNAGLPASLDTTTIKFDPSNPNTLFTCIQNDKGGLYFSTNNGANWSVVPSTIEIAGKFGINDIHFAKDGKVYITSGYKNANENDGGLWVSNDQMKSWKKIFDYPWVNRVEVAPYNPNIILINTLANVKVELINPGAFLSKDGGKTWSKINKGNGQSDRINDIAIDYFTPNKYYLSTYGSGFYVAKEK